MVYGETASIFHRIKKKLFVMEYDSTRQQLPGKVIPWNRDLKVDGCPSKENLFVQFALLMIAPCIVFP